MLQLNHKHITTPEDLVSRLQTGNTENAVNTSQITLTLIRNYITDRVFPCIHQFNLPNLRELHLGANELTILPDLSLLTTLTVLHLNNNKISDLCAWPLLPSLVKLDLRSNRIASLSQAAPIPTLAWLSLSCNQLTSLEHLPAFPSLKYLGLFANYLFSAYEACQALASSCPAVESLFLSGNDFEESTYNSAIHCHLSLRVLDNRPLKNLS